MLMGDWDMEDFSLAASWPVASLLFMFDCYFVHILLLNLLIAIMGQRSETKVSSEKLGPFQRKHTTKIVT